GERRAEDRGSGGLHKPRPANKKSYCQGQGTGGRGAIRRRQGGPQRRALMSSGFGCAAASGGSRACWVGGGPRALSRRFSLGTTLIRLMHAGRIRRRRRLPPARH